MMSSLHCSFPPTTSGFLQINFPQLPKKIIHTFPTLRVEKLQRTSTVTAFFGLQKPLYKLDALEPYLRQITLEINWGKHHRNYLEDLNKQLENNDVLYGHTKDELVKVTYNNGNPMPEFNNAAQVDFHYIFMKGFLLVFGVPKVGSTVKVWNYDFFWDSMQPGGGDMPELGVLGQIKKDFGSFANFREKFTETALTMFGSGWIWLVLKREERRLEVTKTSNAVNPLVWNDIAIICLDMWEHAYYLDYQNDRGQYVNVFLDHLVSWNSAMEHMARAEAFVNLGEPTIPIA